jgi:hypothetical protein
MLRRNFLQQVPPAPMLVELGKRGFQLNFF